MLNFSNVNKADNNNFVSQSKHFALLRLIWSVNSVKSHENRVPCGNSDVFIEIGKQGYNNHKLIFH